MKLCSWNVAGLNDKLQNHVILDFVSTNDLIWLSETKKCFKVNIPGYSVYYNPSKSGTHRGGIMLLIRNKLQEFVKCIDMDTEGQIWIELSFLTEYKLGGVYIPPDDSPYFQQADIGALAAHTVGTANVVVLGDLNGRVAVPSLTDPEGVQYVYSGVVDHTLNARGRAITNVCTNNSMVICNHLSYKGRQLGGNLSFRRGLQWISELDLCLSSSDCLEQISVVNTRQDVKGSDHAPLCVTLDIPSANVSSIDDLIRRSAALGKHTQHLNPRQIMKKSLSYRSTNLNNLQGLLQDQMPPVIPPVVTSAQELSGIVDSACDVIIDSVARCKETNNLHPQWDQTKPRWERLLESQDLKTIWKSLNWRGTFDNKEGPTPSDDEFKVHFERLLSQETPPSDEVYNNINTAPYVPILDDPFSYSELDSAISSMKSNKSYCGICPGIIKMLPITWFIFFLSIFNHVFTQCFYPFNWCYNKLFVLFKSGNRHSCNNYRGISIMDSLAKIFDVLILNRLILWVDIDKCQAGSQKGRSCLEQILTLRLLIDFVKKKKFKLYILFIDYSKAYDRVPRHKLIEVLKSRGCGKVLLRAIYAMYTCTKNILKTAVIDATIGVRQGSPSSCLLFIIYMDVMVRMLKRAFESDGFLGALHALLLMDDTVILSTNRQMCEAKLRVVIEYCKDFGMEINTKKTKYFVINGSRTDRMELEVDGVNVGYCSRYLYLGAWFTDSGKISDVIKLHEKDNQATLNKFSVFCAANTQMPFKYKKLVFDAAVMSSLLYSSESWLTDNIKPISAQYNQLVRCLLGVRKNTCMDLCLVEAGIPPANNVILKRRSKYLRSIVDANDRELPFTIALGMCKHINTPGFKYISKCLRYDIGLNPLSAIVEAIKIRCADSTKYRTYATVLNPTLSLHPIYDTNIYIPDYQRVAFSRIRLMSHNLKIETGRWSRTPPERRVCHCDNIQPQTEEHVLIYCPLTRNLRLNYPMLNFTDINFLFREQSKIDLLCFYINEV